MNNLRRHAKRLWSNQRGISAVEYAILLAFIGTGIIAAADLLSNAISNQMTDTTALLDGSACDNVGGGDGTGGDGGTGEGGDNTC